MSSRRYLRQVVKPGIDVDLDGMGDATACPQVNIEIKNDEEQWTAILSAFDSAVEMKSIHISCFLTFANSSRVRPGGDRIVLLSRLCRNLLHGLHIELPAVGGESAS